MENASKALRGDFDYVLAAVQQDGRALQYASEELQKDRDIVLAAVQQNGFALTYASDELKNDRDIVLAAVQQDGRALQYASEELQKDRDIVLAAVQQNGFALTYASDELKNDRDIVLAAVQQDGRALTYASDELKRDLDIVLTAVQKNGDALYYTSKELKNDRDIVLAAVQQTGYALIYASDELKKDRDIVLAAVQQAGYALEYASDELRQDRDIVLAAVQQDGYALEYASDELRQDRDIVLAAIQQDGSAMQFALYELRQDRDIMLAAVQQNGLALEHTSEEMQQNREALLLCVESVKSEEGAETIHRWVDEKEKATLLKCLVTLDNTVAYLRNRDGKRAIDRGIQACRDAMYEALRLFGKFDPDDKSPLLHTSRTSVVFKAFSFQKTKTSDCKEEERVPHALKCMREYDQVFAELKGREHLDSDLIVQLHEVYVATSVDDSKIDELKEICPGVQVIRDENLRNSISSIISNKLLQAPKNDDEKIEENAYPFVLVFEFGGRTLEAAWKQDRIVGQSDVARHILTGIARACGDLHESGRIHGDLKPLNIVLVGIIPKLIDLDVSCQIGKTYGKKAPSTGYCAPEVARQQTNMEALKGSVAHDLFSFGAIMFLIEASRPLWNTNQDGDVDEKNDVRRLLNWKVSTLNRTLNGISCSEEAKDLMRMLLEPNPEKRVKNFTDESFGIMEMVLKQPYFSLREKLDKMDKNIRVMSEDIRDIKTLTLQQREEVHKMKDDFMRGIYEANEVTVPTTFVILEKKLTKVSKAQKELLDVHLKDNGTGFKFVGRIPDEIENGKAVLEDINIVVKQVHTWAEILTNPDFEDKGGNDQQEKFFDLIKKRVKALVPTVEKMYFYPVDELTGDPVEGGGYPKEIINPSEFLPEVFSWVTFGMRGLSFYNGTAGIAQMFGLAIPRLPSGVSDKLNSLILILQQRSSVEEYGVLQRTIDDGDVDGKPKCVRGALLRELKNFYEKQDSSQSYAGLERIWEEDGTAIWTRLKGEEALKCLKERTELRKKEELSGFKSAQKQQLEKKKQQLEIQKQKDENERQKLEIEKLRAEVLKLSEKPWCW